MARLFSGMQPTGTVHIGNYLGAVQNWVRLQDQYEAFYSIVDYHSMTVEYDAQTLSSRVFELAVNFLASGVDPNKSALFVQSHVPEHAELTWILSTVTPMGELARMTQFKDKARQHTKNINTGLFTYPVLQAADILIYKAEVVPVGEDQVQHIELARDIARKFNNRFGVEFFPECKPLLTQMVRVLGLDGKNKMSKSLGNHVALDEGSDALWKKLAAGVTDPKRIRRTDSGEPNDCNIYSWHQFFSDEATIQNVATGCRTACIGCIDCKKMLFKAMDAWMEPFREKMADFRARPDYVWDVLEDGAARAREVARQTMDEVRLITGLRTTTRNITKG